MTTDDQILNDVRAGRRPLTEALPGLRRDRFVYQLDPVRDWLSHRLAELPPKGMAEAGDDARPWYLRRGDDVFGPLAFRELCELNRERALRPEDVLFSLAGEACQTRPADLPALNADGATAPPLHVNRRSRRLCTDAPVEIRTATGTLTGTMTNISPRGAAVILGAVLAVGDEVGFKSQRSLRLPAIDTVAVVVSATLTPKGHSYGFRFPILSPKIVALLASAVQRSA